MPPTMSQFGSSIGIGPVAVGAVVVKTAAAILVVTINACVKMGTAEILIANNTYRGASQTRHRRSAGIVLAESKG
jgi:hypothetical protein